MHNVTEAVPSRFIHPNINTRESEIGDIPSLWFHIKEIRALLF